MEGSTLPGARGAPVQGTVTVSGQRASGTWLVALHGEHDLSTAPRLAQTSAIWPQCKVAVIDLSAAAFIDSGTIKWLLDVERQLEAAGASTLSIVEGHPGSAAARTLALLGVSDVLACYRTREDPIRQAPARPGVPRKAELHG